MKNFLLIFASMFFVFGFIGRSVAAGSDVGVIDQVITTIDGTVGFTLVTGVPNSQSTNSCSSGWVGFNNPNDPGYKNVLAAILSAQATGRTVQVITVGCLFSGAWNALAQIYIK